MVTSENKIKKDIDKLKNCDYNKNRRRAIRWRLALSWELEINRLLGQKQGDYFFYYRFLSINIAIIVANTKTKANISLYVTNIQ